MVQKRRLLGHVEEKTSLENGRTNSIQLTSKTRGAKMVQSID